MKKTRLLLLILFSLVLFLFPTKVKAENDYVTVRFTDNNLYTSVKEQIESKVYSTNDSQKSITMTYENLLSIETLSLSNKNINYLSGLDKFKNLTGLDLSNNNIISILPISYLTNLTTLNVSYNNLSYITPITALTELKFLNLEHNEISDVTPIGTLTNLRVLDLAKNSIKDISSFNNLTNLVTLYLEENKVEDVECLNSLSNLRNINLQKQYYEYTVNGNVLSNIKTNINLPTFFVQAKNENYCNYTSTDFALTGASLGDTSNYIVLQNAQAGQRTALVKIVGGNAHGSMMLLKYNSVVVTVSNSSSSPSKVYERVGGTISFTATANGETSTAPLSVSITKNGNVVTNNFNISKSIVNSDTAKFNITVPKTVTPGTYIIKVSYNSKTAVTGSFTIYENPAVSKISLNTTDLTLVLNQNYKLEATILPTNVINKNVVWSSSNSSIVSVDSDGNITAKSTGTATITAKAEDGGKTASCIVNVTKPVTGISLNLDKAVILLDETIKLTATITPSDATNKNVTWSTNNPNVVSINESGIITGKAIGYAVVTVTTEDGKHTARCHVTVKAPDIEPQFVPVQSISLNKTKLTLVEGKAETLVVTILPDNATNKAFSWVSSNNKVATVDSSGKVTAKSVGTAKIIANVEDNTLGTKQAICEVTVISSAITSSTYKIENNIIFDIAPNCDLCELLPDLQIPLSYKVYNSNGNEIIYSTIACTGMYIELENKTRYSLVVTGDVSGDGKISATDIFTLKKHITSVEQLEGVYKNAADLNNSSSITATDLLKMKKAVVGLN